MLFYGSGNPFHIKMSHYISTKETESPDHELLWLQKGQLGCLEKSHSRKPTIGLYQIKKDLCRLRKIKGFLLSLIKKFNANRIVNSEMKRHALNLITFCAIGPFVHAQALRLSLPFASRNFDK